MVDVYSEWAGPCMAMANYLKKIKLDVGDELLQCAMASCDSIEALKMFRGHCKPIWLFIMSGTWLSGNPQSQYSEKTQRSFRSLVNDLYGQILLTSFYKQYLCVPGQPVDVMHGSNAPLLGRIIQQQMERLRTGDPVTQPISLDDAVPGEEARNINIHFNIHSPSDTLRHWHWMDG